MAKLQQRQRFSFAVLHLVHRALAGRVVGTIPEDLRSVPKPAAREMIVGDLDDDLRSDRFPFAGSFRAPAAWTAGRVAGKSRWFLERFELFRQRWALAHFECRGESNVMEQAVIVI